MSDRRGSAGRRSHALCFIVSVLLIAATVATYRQVVEFEFVLLDDPQYVTTNEVVRRGLSTDGLLWALTTGHYSNWHPVTWLSHMLDCQVYGLRPSGHHLTSLILHTVNALLLFGVLYSMTQAVWPSAFGAALFSVHPLHVESVAWVAERKDVLSTLFGLLSIGSYVAYARRGGTRRYLLTAALLALGLLAKPMLVTLPALFLLLDYWPLDRIRIGRANDTVGTSAIPRRSLSSILLEKVPLLALSAASSVVTVIVQQSAMKAAVDVPPLARAANALVAYVRYLGKTIAPTNLAVLYPHPSLPGGVPLSAWQIAGAGLLLLMASALVIRLRRRYVTMGWLWFLIALLPVSGLVQVGEQSMADRYTYLPLIGLFIICAWGAGEVVSRWGSRPGLVRAATAVVAVSLVVVCVGRSRAQVSYWRDSVALFTHALSVGPALPVVHNNLGLVLKARGDLDGAIVQFRRAVAINPSYAQGFSNLGSTLRKRGATGEAIASYRRALEIDPEYAPAHYNLGNALSDQGRLDEAILHYQRAVAIRPGFAAAHRNLARALGARGVRDAGMAARHRRSVETKLRSE